MSNNLKLGVEVVSAHDLVANAKEGSSSPFVELQFDGQKFQTTTKDKDLNPVWGESFYFNISDPNNLPNLPLEAYVYNHTRSNNSSTCLGKVRLTGTSFVPYSDAVVLHYPLETHSIFSRVSGELGLKVFVTDDPSVRPSNPLPVMEFSQRTVPNSTVASTSYQDAVENVNVIPSSNLKEKNGKRRTFHHLPNSKPQQEQQYSQPTPIQQTMDYRAYEMRSDPQPSRSVLMFPGSSSQRPDYAIKETSPFLGGGQVVGGQFIQGDRAASNYDLVEQMSYLFVRVVKARDLPSKYVTGTLDPYVELRVGNYKGYTQYFGKNQNPEWNQVFAFARDTVQSSVLEVVVKDKDMLVDDFAGILKFDLNEVPTRVPPDSLLAPEWYRLESKKREKSKGELMLAVWYGTQADETFPDAWHSDAISPTDSSSFASTEVRSKVYHSPRLWYVRINVVEAQDLVVTDKNRFPDAYVKVQIGGQIVKTRAVQARSNPVWNDDLMLVAAEPFEEPLILTIEDRMGPNKDEIIGRAVIPLTTVEKRADDRYVSGRWCLLEKSLSTAMDGKEAKTDRFSSRLHIRVCLDGGYHVLEESTHSSSDLRPTAKQLWKPSVGVLELGVLNAEGLHPMKTRDGKGTSDTYCVAKYGHKWIRTRTIIDSLSPKYNEQYTWEVFDPATVLTVGVFDNGQIGGSNAYRDAKIGKIRIRISTLESGRVYTHSYPLLVLHPSGVKKMGELHLAIRFSYTSMVDMLHIYSKPLLPKMHYIRPLTVMQQDMLRHQAVNIVAARLSRAEPPLRKEVVEYMSYMSYTNAHLWSMRRSKANFFRLMSVFSGLLTVGKWFGEVCMWKNPITTALVHVLFVMLVCFPELILPTFFLYMFVIGVWNYCFRPTYPPHMNTRLSYAEAAHPDELDEEFDTFPTSRSSEVVRMRYDRLRSVAGRIQTVVGDIATQGERLQAPLNWRDPGATAAFVIFCLLAAIVLYLTPFQVLALLAGFYIMRHPRFRHRTPSMPINFFRRLPARTDSML